MSGAESLRCAPGGSWRLRVWRSITTWRGRRRLWAAMSGTWRRGGPRGSLMGTVRDLAEKLWNGEIRTDDYNPLAPLRGVEEIADRTAVYCSFANVTAFET